MGVIYDNQGNLEKFRDTVKDLWLHLDGIDLETITEAEMEEAEYLMEDARHYCKISHAEQE